MNETRESTSHLSSIIGISLLVIGFAVFGVVGQKAWSHQTELTRSFEACMESAPFKTALSVPRPESVLTVEDLQNHFDNFDQIFKETGLPPIWNGKTLIPWKIYHKSRSNLQGNAMFSWASISLNDNSKGPTPNPYGIQMIKFGSRLING